MRPDPTPSVPDPTPLPDSEVSIGSQLWGMLIPTVAAIALLTAMGRAGEWW